MNSCLHWAVSAKPAKRVGDPRPVWFDERDPLQRQRHDLNQASSFQALIAPDPRRHGLRVACGRRFDLLYARSQGLPPLGCPRSDQRDPANHGWSTLALALSSKPTQVLSPEGDLSPGRSYPKRLKRRKLSCENDRHDRSGSLQGVGCFKL